MRPLREHDGSPAEDIRTSRRAVQEAKAALVADAIHKLWVMEGAVGNLVENMQHRQQDYQVHWTLPNTDV